MDTNIYSKLNKNIYHSDTRNYPINHKIRTIMFDHLDYLHKLDASGKARSCVLDNVERSLLCNTVYLGFDLFECPNCRNESIVAHKCHSRFCNACGVKYAKQLAAKAVSSCLDVTHRHMVFSIPESLRRIFREDRSRMNLLFVASRNTISSIVNHHIYRKAKRLGFKNTHYLYKNYRHANQFGMITTLHTFGRDLKWNPHIHALVPEMIYNPDKDTVKPFHHFDFKKLRLTFQYELLRLLHELLGPSFKPLMNQIYKQQDNGFYVYARTMEDNPEFNDEKNSKDINGCINYCMRYASRPAMAESRIIDYCRENDSVTWFYHDHKDEKKHIVKDKAVNFINRLILHIPDHHFRLIHYYGFYSNAAHKTLNRCHELLGDKKQKDYSETTRKQKREKLLNKLKYRTHLIDTFNRDPLKCKCGFLFKYIETYNPLEGIHNEREYRKQCFDEMRTLQIRRKSSYMDS